MSIAQGDQNRSRKISRIDVATVSRVSIRTIPSRPVVQRGSLCARSQENRDLRVRALGCR